MNAKEIAEWLLKSDSSHLVILAEAYLDLMAENERMRSVISQLEIALSIEGASDA